MKRKLHTAGVIVAIPLVILLFVYRESPWVFALGSIELVLIAIVVTGFVLIYSRKNWRANPWGRALMYSKMSLASLAIISITTGFLGADWPYRAPVRAILFFAILYTQSRLVHLLFSKKEQAGRDEYDRINSGEEG